MVEPPKEIALDIRTDLTLDISPSIPEKGRPRISEPMNDFRDNVPMQPSEYLG